MHPKSMYTLFTKFGVVRDVFIPNKRRSATKTRFDFVRFDCPVVAQIAEQKANGLWIDNKSLVVKSAIYGKEQAKIKWRQPDLRGKFVVQQDMEVVQKNVRNPGKDNRSFVKVLKGVEKRGTTMTPIEVKEIGNGWLYLSKIMRLKLQYSNMELKEELNNRDLSDVVVRRGGGMDVIITFKSKEELRSKESVLNAGFHKWCEYIIDWAPGLHLDQERLVWLSCYGIPLNLWNSDTFRKIGKAWGELVNFDEDVCEPSSFSCGRIKIVTNVMELINSSLNLECKGRIYPTRVCEEQTVNEVKSRCRCSTYEGGRDYGSSNVHGEAQKVEAGRKEEDDDVIADEESAKEEVAKGVMADQGQGRCELEVEGRWEVVSVVIEPANCLGKSNVIGPDIEVSLLREESRQLQRHNHEGQLVEG
ncbi:hypothetical protein ACSBR1_027180 [Camellia fascicularis]